MRMRNRELREICHIKQINNYSLLNKRQMVIKIITNETLLREQEQEQERRRKVKWLTRISKSFKKIMHKWCDKEIINYYHPHFNDIEEQEFEKQCVICLTNRRFFAGKCGHFVLCGECSSNIWNLTESLCPICREEWTDVRQIFI